MDNNIYEKEILFKILIFYITHFIQFNFLLKKLECFNKHSNSNRLSKKLANILIR